MSYNGIGLQTARGSGTSGYVQSSLASIQGNENSEVKSGHFKRRKFQKQRKLKENEKSSNEIEKAKARNVIIQHNNKRYIEVRCMELREKLEDNNDDEDVIQEKVNELREKLMNEPEKTAEQAKKPTESGDASLRKRKAKDEIHEMQSEKSGTDPRFEYKPRYSNSSSKEIRASRRR